MADMIHLLPQTITATYHTAILYKKGVRKSLIKKPQPLERAPIFGNPF